MDVTGWTIDQKMRLPDWCFGNRYIISTRVWCDGPTVHAFGISEVALPDPVCIWRAIMWFKPDGAQNVYVRLGLRATIPADRGEMDGAAEIFPYLGQPWAGPNRFWFRVNESVPIIIELKKGMATGGLKLVAEAFTATGTLESYLNLVVSGLPTRMAGWLEHSLV